MFGLNSLTMTVYMLERLRTQQLLTPTGWMPQWS